METIKLSDNKEFKKVKDYMSDYFQNSKHYLFSDSVDVLTKIFLFSALLCCGMKTEPQILLMRLTG